MGTANELLMALAGVGGQNVERKSQPEPPVRGRVYDQKHVDFSWSSVLSIKMLKAIRRNSSFALMRSIIAPAR